MLLRWLGYENVDLASPLSPDECVRRLRTVIQSEWRLFGSSPAIGRVSDSSLTIRKRPPPFFHNSFQTRLRATIRRDGTGTRLRCRLGLHPFVAVFMAFWFLMLWAMAATGAVTLLWHGNGGIGLLPMVLGPILMTVFGVGLVAVCRYMARNERQFLLDLLRDTIEAHEAPGIPADSRTVERAAPR